MVVNNDIQQALNNTQSYPIDTDFKDRFDCVNQNCKGSHTVRITHGWVPSRLPDIMKVRTECASCHVRSWHTITCAKHRVTLNPTMKSGGHIEIRCTFCNEVTVMGYFVDGKMACGACRRAHLANEYRVRTP